MDIQTIRLEEIQAFIALLPNDQRKEILRHLFTLDEEGDEEAAGAFLWLLWMDVIRAHKEAAAEHRFDELILEGLEFSLN